MRIRLDIDWPAPLWAYRLKRWWKERPCRKAGSHDWRIPVGGGRMYLLPDKECSRCGKTAWPETYSFDWTEPKPLAGKGGSANADD